MGLVDLSLPCFFQAGASAIVFLLSLRYITEPKRASVKQNASANATDAAAPARPYKCWLVANALVGGMLMLVMTMWQTILPVHGASILNLDANKIGLIMGSTGLMIAVAQFAVFVPASARCSFPVIGCFGLPLIGLTAAIPLLEEKLWFLILVCLAQGFGMSLSMPGVSMTVNLLSPASQRGGLMSLTIMWQALMRVIAPIIAGPLYDLDRSLPFIIMLGAIGIALVLEMLLILRVPRLRRKQQIASEKKDEEKGQEVKDEEAERQALLESFYTIHEELNKALSDWQSKKAALEAGQSSEELGLNPVNKMPPEPSLAVKQEFGVWFADMLWQHNFKRWHEHRAIVECLCKNAFPKLRDYPMDINSRMQDLEHILESHLMLEKQWEQFVIQRSAVPLAGTTDFDWAAITELASRSRTNSDADRSENGSQRGKQPASALPKPHEVEV